MAALTIQDNIGNRTFLKAVKAKYSAVTSKADNQPALEITAFIESGKFLKLKIV